MISRLRTILLALAALSCLCNLAVAQKHKPAAPPAVALSMTLEVDATEAPRHIVHARMVIPATPGDFVLYYPKWIPGTHEPSGPLVDTAGIFFTAGGKALLWHRDTIDMYAYHVEVPAGASQIEARMDAMSPVDSAGEQHSTAWASAQLAALEWNTVLLYPKGWTADQIQVQASLRLPAGWKYATALPVASDDNAGTLRFEKTTLTTLVDSPVLTGAHMKKLPLQTGQSPAHELDIAADSEAALAVNKFEQQCFENLVAEAGALFGSHHYRDYHFLLSLSDHVMHDGLEHHESNDSSSAEHFLIDADLWRTDAALLPHEFTHSWNGKYRRPADLTTADFQAPMQDDLLWVYEGMTEYLGLVLTARSGMWPASEWREEIARLALHYTYQSGRRWRSVEDTATSAQTLYFASTAFADWRRWVDYYDESALIWLEADVIIRQQSGGEKSLDDFTRLFHGGGVTPPMVKTYTFDDVVNALNEVQPYDWRGFLNQRFRGVGQPPPLAGIENGGWHVVYTDKPSEITHAHEQVDKEIELTASLGLTVSQDGNVVDVVEGGLAARAGVGPGMHIVAVNGRRFSTELLVSDLVEGRSTKEPLQLIVENAEFFRTVSFDYHDGPRYPHLERDGSKPDLLGEIVKARASTPPEQEGESEKE